MLSHPGGGPDERPNPVRRKLEAGDAVLGAALQIDSPWLVEILALAGFDYVLLDGEHGFVQRDLALLVLAAQGAGIVPIVRVPSHDRGFLLPALETGAGGVQVPMVESAADAARLVQETKYAPLGRRGFSGATRAARYGRRTSREVAEAGNRDTLLVVQLETARAVQNAPEIAQVPGVDVVFVGPADLAQSMGLVPPPGNPSQPALIETMRRAFGACRGRVALGSSVFSAEQVRLWRAEGVAYFLCGTTSPIRVALEGLRGELLQALAAESPAGATRTRAPQ
jgi:4-hydroxy-2-oxoheptanedioate aldolase